MSSPFKNGVEAELAGLSEGTVDAARHEKLFKRGYRRGSQAVFATVEAAIGIHGLRGADMLRALDFDVDALLGHSRANGKDEGTSVDA